MTTRLFDRVCVLCWRNSRISKWWVRPRTDEKQWSLFGKLTPDIVIMDISMPNLNGIDATRKIVGESGDVKVIALSMHSSRRFVTEMLKAGASGYILKECLFDELLEAIRTVLNGGIYLSPKITGVVVDDYVKRLSQRNTSRRRRP